MAHIKSLNISSEKGIGKTPKRVVNCIEGYGFEGDAHGGDGHRQVSLLALESLEKLKAYSGKCFPVGLFGENITTVGIALDELEVGSVLKIGDTMHIVTQVGMSEELLFTRVVVGGTISVGDPILVLLK